ncbi:MAG TPA: hypothetical protein VHG27_10680 [Xanthobacteraceae bacterium]|nr:hypothetical protein [Xanthobacteraceae bacterium]
MRRHALVLALVLVGTAGCRHYEQFVFDAHERYEDARQLDRAEPVTGDVKRTRPRRASVRSHPALAERTGRFRLHPRTPYVGSAEWREEEAQTARRERDIKRKLQSICAGC